MALTYGSFAGVIVSLRYVTRVPSTPTSALQAPFERIVLVVPRTLDRTYDDEPATERAPTAVILPASRPVGAPPSDTGAVPSTTVPPTLAPTSAPATVLSSDAVSRLARPRPDAGAWIALPGVRDPFAPSTVPTVAQHDSVLTALSTIVPDLAARRVPTRAERDSAAKAATLKMRLAGRPLLVPPDNSGGLITARIPLPGGPSRAARARALRAHDEGQARLRRLAARADSLRRAREDSLRSATLARP